VQAGTLDHDEGTHMVGAGPHGQPVRDVEEGEGTIAVTSLHS